MNLHCEAAHLAAGGAGLTGGVAAGLGLGDAGGRHCCAAVALADASALLTALAVPRASARENASALQTQGGRQHTCHVRHSSEQSWQQAAVLPQAQRQPGCCAMMHAQE
jgi:hypothetical protein